MCTVGMLMNAHTPPPTQPYPHPHPYQEPAIPLLPWHPYLLAHPMHLYMGFCSTHMLLWMLQVPNTQTNMQAQGVYLHVHPLGAVPNNDLGVSVFVWLFI